MKRYLFLLIFCACSSVYPYGSNRPEYKNGPWFTGPLLTPAAYTVPPGHVNVEPYLFVNRKIGQYEENWKANSQNKSTSVVLQLPIQIGVTSFIDFSVIPSGSYTNVQGNTAYGFNDLGIKLNFELWQERPGSMRPAAKFFIREEFPTGKYQHLNPKKRGADASGAGAYTTAFGFTFSKLFTFEGFNYLRLRTNFAYSISSAVHVEGFNSYGGNFHTDGKVYPGNEFAISIGLEYTPTLHVAFALDILGITAKKSPFKGNSGIPSSLFEAIASEQLIPLGDISVGNQSSEQLSLAPAIEYNFSQNIGIISGVWFTVLGRNTPRYVNGVIALNMYF